MEKTIIRLLEISRQLEEANLGEFDFGNLRSALLEFEQKAPEILQLEKDFQVLSNHLMLKVMGKIRTLKAGGQCKVSAVWENHVLNSPGLTPQKLIDLDNHLRKDLNRFLSSRPNFQKVTTANDNKIKGDEYKIGR
jgi:hypothetical protein